MAIVLSMAFSGCTSVRPGQTKMPLTFIQLSDPQLGFYHDSLQTEIARYEKAASEVNRLKPDFVVITGDLVHHARDTAELGLFKRITAEIDPRIPVYYVPGNHDVGNTPAQGDLDFYKGIYGYDRFSFEEKHIRFIGLNSSLIQAGTPGLEEDQYRWLEQQLIKGRSAMQTIIFCHHPFFITGVEEPDDYFNIPHERRIKYLELFKKYGVSAVFAGHYHGNAYGKYGIMEMVTTSAVGQPLHKDPPGFTIVSVNKTGLTHEYRTLDHDNINP
jgi:serine/threonine-protein phosphatase CPPED1